MALYRRGAPFHDGGPRESSPVFMSSDRRSDLALVAGVLAGNSGAMARFLKLASPLLWSIVQKLEPAGPDAESSFLQIVAALEAGGYARLRAFDGRARLSTYLALVARDVLSARLASRLVATPRTAWRAFERFFEADIHRRIVQRFPRDEAAWQDIYQDICLKLVEDDFRRVRAYDGRGSFVGYVLTVVERILIDHMRRHVSRRRLPAAVARLSHLDREIYVAVVWERCPADAKRVADALRGRFDPVPQLAEIGTALHRLAAVAALDADETAPGRRETIPLDRLTQGSAALLLADGSPTPEERLLLEEEDRSRAELLSAIRLAAADLPAEDRCYLQAVFSATDPLPPREIARIMGCKVEDVYRLRQRARRWVAQIAERLEKHRSRPSQQDSGDLDHGTAPSRAI
jgi:RNA polymerase primary sigma factor